MRIKGPMSGRTTFYTLPAFLLTGGFYARSVERMERLGNPNSKIYPKPARLGLGNGKIELSGEDLGGLGFMYKISPVAINR